MQAIIFNKVIYTIGGRNILNHVTQQVKVGERIGLIGSNGSGKTTLARLLTGNLQPDDGKLIVTGRVSYVPQLNQIDHEKSDGEQMMMRINEALVRQPDILILDEPTSNLDMQHQNWLIRRLNHFYGTLIIISHDTYLLNKTSQSIWAISDTKLISYSGNYDDYLYQKNMRFSTQTHKYNNAVTQRKHLKRAIDEVQRREKQVTKRPKNISPSDARLISGKGKALKSQKKLAQNVKSMTKRLSNLEQIDKPLVDKSLKLQAIVEQNSKPKTMLKVLNEQVTRNGRLLIKNVNFNLETGQRLAILGPNGTGKTTLIKQILVNNHDSYGYFTQNLATLIGSKTIIENVLPYSSQTSQVARDFLGAFGLKRDKVFQPVDTLSGGEKVKVLLLQVLLTDTRLLVLDEPTNFLDLSAIDALANFLLQYEGAVLFVSHYRDFVTRVATKKMMIKDETLIQV
ncbi:ABC-F family ATP-binding cassette domain-containing protein [Leuconostoc inhae]|uniref:ABC-F family ATP-binding cassette domain-containing protein n=1 Tax=Leuconostoc inhae TaxID=178001 RepID=UPI001C7CBC0F|nr:ATP-binding cassette domain-containing protein [Leuconostoc inhae]